MFCTSFVRILDEVTFFGREERGGNERTYDLKYLELTSSCAKTVCAQYMLVLVV